MNVHYVHVMPLPRARICCGLAPSVHVEKGGEAEKRYKGWVLVLTLGAPWRIQGRKLDLVNVCMHSVVPVQMVYHGGSRASLLWAAPAEAEAVYRWWRPSVAYDRPCASYARRRG